MSKLDDWRPARQHTVGRAVLAASGRIWRDRLPSVGAIARGDRDLSFGAARFPSWRWRIRLALPARLFRRRSQVGSRITTVFGMVLGLMALNGPTAAGEVLVANPSVADSELSRGAARAIFGMRLRVWSDDRRIRVFVLPDNDPNHADFCQTFLSIFPYQLRQNWDRLVFSGTGQAPNVVESLEEMREIIATTKGAVGYLSSEMIDDTVRVLQVN